MNIQTYIYCVNFVLTSFKIDNTSINISNLNSTKIQNSSFKMTDKFKN